jgi:hypothetical protein
MHTHRGLAQEKVLGSTGEVFPPGHFQKYFELVKIHGICLPFAFVDSNPDMMNLDRYRNRTMMLFFLVVDPVFAPSGRYSGHP